MNITEEIYAPETGDLPCYIGPLSDRSMLGIIHWMIRKTHPVGRDLAEAIKDGETIFQAMNRFNR